MRAYERLLKYVSVYTTSDPDSATVPSSMRQYDLANILVDELKALGLENVHVDENGVVYGWLSATAGCEQKPALGFIAHLDTAPDCSGENVKPQIIEHYDGGDVLLAGSGETLSPAAFPGLKKLVGMTLITTDGTTLLGADDKAGIAEIMTALENILAANAPHGKLCIAFTPDEEIGAGVDHFDVAKFGADCAYTLDGGEEGEIAYETFNACSAELHFDGLSVHPGSSKDTMINAALVAMEYNALLPAGDIPRLTEGYEGFFHLCDMKGQVEQAVLDYIIRDHDRKKFEVRKAAFLAAAEQLNAKYGPGTAQVAVQDRYYNMKEQILPHMEIVDRAKAAMEKNGVTPKVQPIRGGTDGARLSFMGLPCPNLCACGENFHGRYEYVPVEDLEVMTRVLKTLICDLV